MITINTHDSCTRFSLRKFNHGRLEKLTKAFLDDQQEKGGPPIYTPSLEKARAVLSGLQVSTRVKKRTIGWGFEEI
jgi:hypothetical protein